MRHETSNDAVNDETVTLFNDAFFTHHNHVAMSAFHSVDRVDNCHCSVRMDVEKVTNYFSLPYY